MMQGEIFKHWQIPVATVFSVVLIVGVYVFARGVESPTVAQASEETALLQAIASKDSDSDGLPDWEESLYGTDPHVADTFHLGMTDGEAVAKGLIVPKAIADIHVATSSSDGSGSIDPSLPPAPADGTLTASFAQNFFLLFMAAKQANGGADLSESQMNDIATNAMNSLVATVTIAPDYKSAKDLPVSSLSAFKESSFKTFAINAEALFMNNTADATTTALKYLKSALENNDTTAYPHILSIAKAYRDTAVGLSVLSVPKELVADDLLLMNSMMRLSGIINDFVHSSDDPLTTILALKQYPDAVKSMGTALKNIGDIYAATGISLPPGTPGASFVNLAATTKKASEAAVKKP